MPQGIIMQSSSHGATPEAIEKVLAENGYEVSKPEESTEPVEPKREDFPSQEAYAKAHDEFKAKQTPTEVEEQELTEPKREDFKTDEEFDDAHEEFETAQEEAEDKAAQEEEKKRLAALPKKTRRQKAIEKATKPLQSELNKLRDELAALQGKTAKPAAEAETKIETPKAPKREDFKTDAEYDDALFDYRYQMRRSNEQKEEQKKAFEKAQKDYQARLEQNFKNYQSQVAAFKEEHDDWDEVVNQTDIPIHESVYLAVQEQENGAQVTYYLGKHPDYARRLAELSPLSAVMEIGKLAERLKPASSEPGANGRPEKKPTPRPIPEPVRPVSTAATSSTLTSREAAKNRDYKAFKQAQRKGA
jgi:hypothetical protein